MQSLLKILLLVHFAGLPVLGLTECVQDRERLLSLEFSEFDQDMEGGWRRIAAMPYCAEEAADLIAEYRRRRDERHIALIFHEGQLRARVGQIDRAIALFEDSRTSPEKDRFGWNHYVEATIAFLRKDREALLESRDALAALEEPEDFQATVRNDGETDISWPPNLEVVEGFVACFDRPYSAAYGCR